jgi:dihydrofolate reductase
MPAKLIYSAIASLDGYIADKDGRIEWAAPDEEVHGYVNDLTRPIGTHLLGRRMYEVLHAWDTVPTDDGPQVMRDFAAMWQGADKIVYSTTLAAVSGPRTRLEHRFDPDAVRELKSSAERDLTVGGPGLAAAALSAGLVDELELFLHPLIVGGGTAALPGGIHLDLELLDERRFASGVAFLRYSCSRP